MHCIYLHGIYLHGIYLYGIYLPVQQPATHGPASAVVPDLVRAPTSAPWPSRSVTNAASSRLACNDSGSDSDSDSGGGGDGDGDTHSGAADYAASQARSHTH